MLSTRHLQLLRCSLSLWKQVLFLFVVLTIVIQQQTTVRAHWPHDVIDGLITARNGTEIYVTARQALLLSLDQGVSWRVVRQLSTYKQYMKRSPHPDETLYVHDGGKTMLRTTDLFHWDVVPIDACQVYHATLMLNRIEFTSSGALISGNGRIYKEDTSIEGGFKEIFTNSGAGFGYCPPLAADSANDIVYAGGMNGILQSMDGGSTWSLLVPMNKRALQLEFQDDEVFAMTDSGVCHVINGACRDINLPEPSSVEKTRDGPSPPTDLTYTDGALIVTRTNSLSVYRTTDFGQTWQYRNRDDGDFPTDGHYPPKETAWVQQRGEEFTCVDGQYLCTWTGLFRTVDGGASWMSRNTLRRSIINFNIIKEGHNFTIMACGYSIGCYHGPPSNLQPHPTLSDGSDSATYYDSLALSPKYNSDGIGFENTGYRLHRFDGTSVNVVSINGFFPFIKGVLLAPDFATSGTMFAYGYNFGVIVSKDKGRTFQSLFLGDGFANVVKLVLSPTFRSDGTMACLVDPNYVPNDPWKESTHLYVYVSQNYGVTWRRLVWQSSPYRDIIIVAGDPVPFVVIIHENGRLYGHTSDLSAGWFKFRPIPGTRFRPVRPKGFYRGGLAVSPDGKTLAAGFAEGGVMYGEISRHNITRRRFSNPNPWNNLEGEYLPPFVHNPPGSADVHGRVLSSHIAFSPEYETDQTMFATDLLSIYTSVNRGYTWSKVFEFNEDAL